MHNIRPIIIVKFRKSDGFGKLHWSIPKVHDVILEFAYFHKKMVTYQKVKYPFKTQAISWRFGITLIINNEEPCHSPDL